MLTDLAGIAPCLPGAELTDQEEDGSYGGTFTVKTGPTTASYRGKIHFEERDAVTRRAVMRASGQDTRGQGRATATMIATVAEDGGTSKVTVNTDLVITGMLASLGQSGMIEDTSNRLLADFASCLQTKLAASLPPPPAPAEAPARAPAENVAAAPDAISDSTAVVTTAPGMVRRTAPAIGVAVLAVAALVVWRRRR
jgi:carbon monoxide dehydrogenase subunit G